MIRSAERFCILALAAGLAACGSEPPSTEEYFAVAADAIRFAEADARTSAPPGSGTGPLLLNVASFAVGSRRATTEDVPVERMERELRARLDRDFEPTRPDSSFNCFELPVGHSCWVPGNGVFVHLNLATRGRDEISLYVASTVTASHYIPPVLCDRVNRLEYAKRENAWVLEDHELIKSC